DEEALVSAVKDGKVSGAAFDVFAKEPPDADNPLLALDEVIVTPHLGASTTEAQENVAVAVANQMADYLVNGTIKNAINVPSVPAELLTILSPYITLADKLGSFQGQFLAGGIEEVSVEYSGEVAEFDVAPITIACLKGLLGHVMDQTVNFVNAPSIAKERGIKVIEVKSSLSADYASSVTLRVKTGSEEHIIEGVIFGKSEPRIVRVNRFSLDVIPEGFLLFLHNEDKPCVIGNVGTLLGEGSINIARLHLGRESVGKEAVSVWNIDTPLSDELMEKLLKLPNIISAKVVEL
ncbi:MAG: NAD(P)-dependent oxidoreductase, partial [Thermodesulfobacteriota bacterium]